MKKLASLLTINGLVPTNAFRKSLKAPDFWRLKVKNPIV